MQCRTCNQNILSHIHTSLPHTKSTAQLTTKQITTPAMTLAVLVLQQSYSNQNCIPNETNQSSCKVQGMPLQTRNVRSPASIERTTPNQSLKKRCLLSTMLYLPYTVRMCHCGAGATILYHIAGNFHRGKFSRK